MAWQFSMNSAIKYLTTAVFTAGLGSLGGNLRCHFFLLLYIYDVPRCHCICIFTNTYNLYAFVVFQMYSIQYVYILLSCKKVFFFLPQDWYGQRIQQFFLTTQCGHYGYTIYVQESLSFCLFFTFLSSRLSLCTDFLCVSLCVPDRT